MKFDVFKGPLKNINWVCSRPEYDPRNLSSVAMILEAGFSDLVIAVQNAAERIGDAIDAHASELGRQRQ